MHGGGFFYQALVYLTAAVVSVPIAKRLGLGSVLGYLLAGVAIGPFALGLVGEEGQDVLHFAEFGVVLMLFLIGLELEPRRVWRMRAPILGLGGLQVGVTTAVLAGLALAFDLGWRMALASGVILALSSTAIVLQTLNEKDLLSTRGGQSSFAVLLFQDIAVIPILALLPLLARPGASEGAAHGGDHSETWVEGLPAWAEGLAVLAAVAVIVLAGRFVLRPAFRAIARTGLRELFTAAALLLVIATAVLMTKVGVSPALGTFLAGVVLARSEYRHELESDIDPFKGLLLGLFFIAIGASIDFGLISAAPGLVLGLMATLIVAKLLVLLLLGRLFGLSLDQNLLFGVSLAQGGEFAFVLLSYALRYGVVGESWAGQLIAAVALTMAATPLLMLLNEKLLQPRVGTRERVDREADEIDLESPVIIAGFGSFGAIVGRLLRANGVRPTVLDLDSDRVDLLRKLGLTVFYGDASRHDLLHAAGAARARLLVLALDSVEKHREILAVVRKHFPHLTVLARAGGRQQAYELIEAGVEHVYRDKLDSSLVMGVEVLRLLGFRAHQAHRAAQKFRRHDEAAVRELASMRHDEKSYIGAARQRIEDLESLLLGDLERVDEMRDAGWDAESLRREYGGRSSPGDDSRG
ncbi:MAG: monovalent cation:proton antiporter-2 (CPA2) family protein [Thermoanaerobaculia bacterium]|nr:monovalent cation:proton antiporter-2 (CPA2) family protein [Thermoanaerobaculia bacterium]